LEQICQYEDNKDIPTEIVQHYKKVSRALIDYERAYYPLPGRVSTLIPWKTTVEVESLETVFA
jgi:dihydrodipicolinate synthase/N-acetylneuraminate lyase